MAFPTKTKVPVAVNSRSNQNLDSVHNTTADFMQFNVCNYVHLVPGQSVQGVHKCFSRLAPMPSPTMGECKIKNKVYFVPYRTVFPGWNDFINDDPHIFDDGTISLVSHAPGVYPGSFVDMLRSEDYSFEGNTTSNTVEGYSQILARILSESDFVYTKRYAGQSEEFYTGYRFTPLGRQAYKILQSLGYRFTFSNAYKPLVSALPLMCLFRVYLDYYYPSQYANDSESAWLLSKLIDNREFPDDGANFSADDLKRAFKIISYVAYNDDYFTSAWDNPNGPNNGLTSTYNIPDVDIVEGFNDSTVVTNYESVNEQTSPIIRNGVGGPPSSLNAISQYMLTALKSLSDYLKRNQIAGSRTIDRYLARYGYQLKSDKLNRSYKVAEYIQPVQFGDVTSTSDTEGAQLGAYAGKGLSYDEGAFDFMTDEYGMLIFVSTIVPDIYYFEGMDRHNNHLTRTDFWVPEFDNLGVQAISKTELYVPVNGTEFRGLTDDEDYNSGEVFGFTPRYAEYRISRSFVTGDYSVNTLNTLEDSWYLGRKIIPSIISTSQPDDHYMEGLEHNYKFVMGLDANQYNRIFYNQNSDSDKFRMRHYFNIQSSFPGKSLFDTYEFEDEDKSKKVTMGINGDTEN